MSQKKKSTPFANRKYRYGAYAALVTALAIAAVVILNVAVGAVERNWALKIDVTGSNFTLVSEQTTNYVKTIDQPIRVLLLSPTGSPSTVTTYMLELLEKYRAVNKNIEYELIDPDREPLRVNKYKSDTRTLQSGCVVVTNFGDTRFKVLYSTDLLDQSINQQTGQLQTYGFAGERALTTAMMFVTAEKTTKAFFLQGHAEMAYTDTSSMRLLLNDQNYETGELTLSGLGMTETPTMSSGDVLFIIAPQKDLLDNERDAIKNFLNDGGRMIFIADYTMPALPNFESLLALYNIGFDQGIVVEDMNETSRWINYPIWLLPELNAEHDLNSNLSTSSGRVLLTYARPVKMPGMKIAGIVVDSLLTSSAKSFVKAQAVNDMTMFEKNATDPAGPFTLAAAISKEDYNNPDKSVRAVVFGSVDALTNLSLLSQSQNANFLIAMTNWAANMKAPVEISSRFIRNSSLSIPDAGTLWLLAAIIVVVIPLIIAILGMFVHLKRRRL